MMHTMRFGDDVFEFEGRPHEPLRLYGTHLSQDERCLWAVDAFKQCWLAGKDGRLQYASRMLLLGRLNDVQRELVRKVLQ
jgi:hypothetical protein